MPFPQLLNSNRKENPQNQKREIIGRESDWQKWLQGGMPENANPSASRNKSASRSNKHTAAQYNKFDAS